MTVHQRNILEKWKTYKNIHKDVIRIYHSNVVIYISWEKVLQYVLIHIQNNLKGYQKSLKKPVSSLL